MAINNSTNVYSNSRYIVDNVAPGAPFTTVQAAINAAVAAGGAASIWLRQGTYTENLTLYDGVNIEGQEQTISIIIGTHTPPATGSFSFTRVGLRSATHAFSSAVAGSALLSCLRCQFVLTNGYVYNLANWTGELRLRWCTDYSTANGVVNNAGGSIVTINHSLIGAGTANVLTANGALTFYSVKLGCPCLFNGTGTALISGACDLAGNIATANTNTVTISQSRISTGAVQAITHNSASVLVLDNVIVKSVNATAIGGAGQIKLLMVEMADSNVIAGTITYTNTGVTRIAEVWSENITRMKFTGFYSWAAAGPYFDDATLGTFKLLVAGTGYIQGQKVTWVAQNITGMTAGNTYFIYIDSTGTIGKTTTRTDALFEDNIVLFECLRDSTAVTNNQVTVKENHEYSYPTTASNYEHDVIGTVIDNVNNGANITLVGTQGIGISGADELADHGLNTTIPDSGGVGVTWIKMFTLAGGKWARQNATTTFTGFWNNAGVATALTAGRFGVYRLYVSKDTLNVTTPTYFAVLDTAQYTNLGNAQTAIANDTPAKASNELASLEMAQLGTIIYRESTATIVQVNIAKSTLRGTTSTGSVGTASLVTTVVSNFNNVLSATDTNVQTALDTLDDFGSATGNQTVNLYTGAGVKAVTLGSLNTTSATTIDTGTGSLLLGVGATDHTTTIGSQTGVSAFNLYCGTGTAELATNGTAHTTAIGSSVGASSIYMVGGTGNSSLCANATDHTLTIGSVTGVSATALRGGTSGVTITGTNGVITANSGTGTISVSSDATNTTVNLATGAGAKLTTLGSTSGASSLALKYGTADFTMASATGTVMSALDTGEITYPLQPAFLAYLPTSDLNVTGNGATYTLGAVTALTEVFDQNADFNVNGTFTAPVTGRYFLDASFRMLDITSAMTNSKMQIITSNRTYIFDLNPYTAFIPALYVGLNHAVFTDMDAADTATTTILVANGVGDTADVGGSASPVTFFSGYLAC